MAACKGWDLEPNNTLVVLDGGKSESDLMGYLDRLIWYCAPSLRQEPWCWEDETVEFREPDLNNEMTGFAIKPGHAPNWVLSIPLFSKGGE